MFKISTQLAHISHLCYWKITNRLFVCLLNALINLFDELLLFIEFKIEACCSVEK